MGISNQQARAGAGAAVVAICTVVFLVDLSVPLGVAAAVPYVIAVLVSMAAGGTRVLIATAIASSALTIVGYFISERDGIQWMVWANRALALGLIWIAALLGLAYKRVAEALRVSNTRSKAIMDTAQDGIIVIDAEGLIESFNRAAERLFAYRARDVIGRNISMLMPSPHQEAHDSYIARYIETGERKIIGTGREVTGKRRDGTIFPMRLAVSEVLVDERRSFTGIVHDVSELREAERSAHQDPLTQLPNRRAFDTILEATLEETHTALLMIDIDHFKNVNDDLGHQKGDEALVKLAAGLLDVVRASDRATCARIGGDEFAVILPGARTETAGAVARRILSQVAPILSAVHAKCGLSVGVAVVEAGTSPSHLIRGADRALYDAKTTRGVVRISHRP